ncbi:MAG: hypothetical protein AAGJ97_14335 [Planctomycetota bacterium]
MFRLKKKSFRGLKLVDRPVQGALARRLTTHWALFVSLAVGLTLAISAITDPFRPLSAHLATAWQTYGPLLLVLASLVPVFVWDSIKLSHRFAGPMKRFRNVTETLAAGQTPKPIALRRGDFWNDYAESLNGVIARVEELERRLGDAAVEEVSRKKAASDAAAAAWAVAEEVAAADTVPPGALDATVVTAAVAEGAEAVD